MTSVSTEIPSRSRRPLRLTPNKDLGYILGLIIGDGWIVHTKANNYLIGLESTNKQYVLHAAKCFHKAFPKIYSKIQERVKTRPFPNGAVLTSKSWTLIANSKTLFGVLRSAKLRDFHFAIPSVLTTISSKVGFISGLFDADGGVSRYAERRSQWAIFLVSKHHENLELIRSLLAQFRISSKLYGDERNNKFELRIRERVSKARFCKIIGFRLKSKQNKLESLLGHEESYLPGYRYRKAVFDLAVVLLKRRWSSTRVSYAIRRQLGTNVPPATVRYWRRRHLSQIRTILVERRSYWNRYLGQKIPLNKPSYEVRRI